jgi:hypothetical protein
MEDVADRQRKRISHDTTPQVSDWHFRCGGERTGAPACCMMMGGGPGRRAAFGGLRNALATVWLTLSLARLLPRRRVLATRLKLLKLKKHTAPNPLRRTPV